MEVPTADLQPDTIGQASPKCTVSNCYLPQDSYTSGGSLLASNCHLPRAAGRCSVASKQQIASRALEGSEELLS